VALDLVEALELTGPGRCDGMLCDAFEPELCIFYFEPKLLSISYRQITISQPQIPSNQYIFQVLQLVSNN
jgi:hypothetical protein